MYKTLCHIISLQVGDEVCPILLRVFEHDISLGMSDLLLPPLEQKPLTSDESTSVEDETAASKEDQYEDDEEERESQRRERKCGCHSTDDECRHFLTYDLFEVCLAFREVHSKRKAIIPIERRSLQLNTSYHDWFMPSFAAWLAVVSEQVYKMGTTKYPSEG